jgi:hypothetical protein
MRVLLLLLMLLPSLALAQDAALEAVYEAADAIDLARSEFAAGRDDEGERLLQKAETQLDAAQKAWPSLPRLGFERARIALLRKRPADAETPLLGSMKEEMPTAEHIRMATLLDEVRQLQGRPSLGAQWSKSADVRNAGVATLAGGIALTVAGLAISYGSFKDSADNGVTPARRDLNRLGWGLAAGGGALAAGGGALTVVGQVQLGQLRAILPGPWRLPLENEGGLAARPVEARIGFALSFRLPAGTP